MIRAVLGTVLAWILVAVLGPVLGRRLPPAASVRLLVSCQVAVAASSLLVGSLLAFTWVAQLPEVIEMGPWSATTLRLYAPVSLPIALGCAVATSGAVVSGLVVLASRLRAMWVVRRACAGLASNDGLVVVPSDRPEAFSTPPPSGRVVVSTGLLDGLTPAQQRVVLAHEVSHLTHWHGWWILAAEVTAAVNPLLLPLTHRVRQAVERWADEDAAADVADRQLVARTLATAALLMRGTRRPAGLAAATGGVPQRVAALLDPPPAGGRAAMALLLTLLLASGVGSLMVQRRADDVFDRAELSTAAHHASSEARHVSSQLPLRARP